MGSKVLKAPPSTWLIRLLALWLALSTLALAVYALTSAPPRERAVLLMGVCLILFWVGIGGGLTWRYRVVLRAWLFRWRLDWRVRFVMLATLLALIEEAITTTLTNLAPWFGVPVGAAYITASTSYLDVVLLHSVVVFVPMFIGWAVLLQRLDFSVNAVFLLFGLNGLIAEVLFGGLQALTAFAMWIFVYGLMIYLPAYTLPLRPQARTPRLWHYALAVVFPLLCAMPVAWLISTLHPYRTHFPPIPPGT